MDSLTGFPADTPVIHQIRRSAIVGRSDAQMFTLVNDVEAYPRRFKWCVSAQVSDRTDSALTARMEMRVGGMTQEFTTRNTTAAAPGCPDQLSGHGSHSQFVSGWQAGRLCLGQRGHAGFVCQTCRFGRTAAADARAREGI